MEEGAREGARRAFKPLFPASRASPVQASLQATLRYNLGLLSLAAPLKVDSFHRGPASSPFRLSNSISKLSNATLLPAHSFLWYIRMRSISRSWSALLTRARESIDQSASQTSSLCPRPLARACVSPRGHMSVQHLDPTASEGKAPAVCRPRNGRWASSRPSTDFSYLISSSRAVSRNLSVRLMSLPQRLAV
jgi:hypothetical protein